MKNIVHESGDYLNLSASGQVKSGPGVLIGIFCASSSSATCKVWAQTTAAVPVLVNTFTLVAGTFYQIPARFSAGLYVTITGTADITVFYS